MLKMLIADDHPIMRERLKQLIIEIFPAVFLTEADDTVSLLEKVGDGEWDIIISDLAMPGGGALHALERLRVSHPHIPVLIISTYPEELYAPRVIKAGAAGFISKDNIDKDLGRIVSEILSKK
jgi:DNA-binding NarL/FixJ family response regulator